MNHFTTRSHTRSRREFFAADKASRPAPSHEEIARLAYSYWEARGRQHGGALDDWFRAERELKDRDSQFYW